MLSPIVYPLTVAPVTSKVAPLGTSNVAPEGTEMVSPALPSSMDVAYCGSKLSTNKVPII